MEKTLELTNAISDPTRFKIYHYIVKKRDPVTVQDIAEEFRLHPNVARMHLTKLENVKLLSAERSNTGKGGRPFRIYQLSNEEVGFHFPYRDYQLLAKVAIESLASFGDAGKTAMFETGKRFGKELSEDYATSFGRQFRNLTDNQKYSALLAIFSSLGLDPEIVAQEQNAFELDVYNCPFKEVTTTQSDIVCGMHAELIKGVLDSLFPKNRLINEYRMSSGCKNCRYKVLHER